MKSNIKYMAAATFMALPLFLSGTAMATYDPTGKTYDGQKLEKLASVTILQAREAALKAHPGQIIDEELEKEKGGSGLRYSFVIKAGAAKYEVGVDAKTGKVLENAAEGKNPD